MALCISACPLGPLVTGFVPWGAGPLPGSRLAWWWEPQRLDQQGLDLTHLLLDFFHFFLHFINALVRSVLASTHFFLHFIAENSSFSLAPEQEGAAPCLAFWGQGAFSSFRGEEEDLSLDGSVTTLLLGADWSGQRWQAGAVLSQSWGNGSYEGDADAEGEISSTVTGVFPYGRYALTPRLGLWAIAGYGWGQLSLNPDGTGDDATPSTTMGMDGLLFDGGNESITLSSTADVLTLKTTSAKVDGLESSEGSLSRLCLGVEAVRPFPLSNGASLLPSLALGIRQDSGDAETGFGVNLGAGILWQAPEQGISGALRGHTPSSPMQKRISRSRAWPSPSPGRPPLLIAALLFP